MTDQIIDKRTVAIPGPMGDVTPAALAAKAGAEAARDAAKSEHDAATAAAATAAGSATQAEHAAQSAEDAAAAAAAAPATDSNVAEIIRTGSQTRLALDAFPHGGDAVFIGDSYTWGAGVTNRLTERFSKLICDALGMAEFNYGDNNAGFVVKGAINTNFYDQAVKAKAEHPNARLVIVMGGRNDGYTAQKAAFTQLAEYLAENFPNARVIIIPWAWGIESYPATIWDKQQAALSEFGARGLEVWLNAHVWIWGRPSLCAGDSIHPNTAGHRAYADLMIQGILTGAPRLDIGWVGSTENGASWGPWSRVSDGLVTNGQLLGKPSGTWAAGEVICTLPTWAAPAGNRYVPCVMSNGAPGILLTKATGEVSVFLYQGNAVGGTIIASFPPHMIGEW